MSESLKKSLWKAGRSLVHILISAVSTAAISALLAWLQNPESVKEVLAGSPQWVVGLWMVVHPLLVTAIDQYKHRSADL